MDQELFAVQNTELLIEVAVSYLQKHHSLICSNRVNDIYAETASEQICAPTTSFVRRWTSKAKPLLKCSSTLVIAVQVVAQLSCCRHGSRGALEGFWSALDNCCSALRIAVQHR
jgi:hypothetical protein